MSKTNGDTTAEDTGAIAVAVATAIVDGADDGEDIVEADIESMLIDESVQTAASAATAAAVVAAAASSSSASNASADNAVKRRRINPTVGYNPQPPIPPPPPPLNGGPGCTVIGPTVPVTAPPPNHPNPYTNVLPQDQISDARRKMNQLLQSQTQAQERLKTAQEDHKLASERVQQAKQNIEITDSIVQNSTEELTDALLQEPTHWNNMYKKMLEFKERNGHVDVKRNPLKAEKEANPDIVKLGSWVGRVRLEARRPLGHPERIEPYKVIALNRLGFNWDPRENYWMEKYEELKHYMQSNGKGKMPVRKDPSGLGVWCDGQVLEYNKFKAGIKPCYISQERIDMLTQIGFIWDRMGSAWRESFEELKKYREVNGHCHVPVNYGDKTLFRWIAKQRKKYKNYKGGIKPALTEPQVKMLKDIDFFEPAELRMAKFRHGQREKRTKASSPQAKSKRGRPPSKTLLPPEALEALTNAAAAAASMQGGDNDADDDKFLVEMKSKVLPEPPVLIPAPLAPIPPAPLNTGEASTKVDAAPDLKAAAVIMNDGESVQV